jgi:hypothetical protein
VKIYGFFGMSVKRWVGEKDYREAIEVQHH